MKLHVALSRLGRQGLQHEHAVRSSTIEQLAGDLLTNATPDQVIATGFNRCNVTTSEGGSIDAEWVFRNAVDRTSTMMQAWMAHGRCRCHDHKFDPLSAKSFIRCTRSSICRRAGATATSS
jgi:hypothetical protein